ncbi:MAG: glycosyltransferase family 4 protein [Planctomycetota bacterium]|nr:glycosyltransferase family 4 protein [Planctomycetota bacterium]
MSVAENKRPAGVLFVSQKPPWPPTDGGSLRAYHLLTALAERRPVTLVTTGAGGAGQDEARAALGERCRAVHFVTDVKAPGVLGRARTLVAALALGDSALLRHNRNPHLIRRVRALLAEEAFAWVHLNHVDVAACLPPEGAPPVVLDTHNLYWVFYERAAALSRNPLMTALERREARLLARREPEVFRAARAVLVCSETERQLVLARDPSLRVEVVPNGADCARLVARPPDPSGPGGRLCFVGDMAYAPNADGARWFIDEVLPLLRGRVEGLSFTVVGKDPPPDLVECARRHPDVEVTGFVRDPAQRLARADLCVVPLRLGAGTRLKILEAFALGLPTVSTRLGAEGIDCVDGEDLVLADEPAEFADAVARLAADPDLRRSLGAAGRRTVEDRYDWAVIGEGLVGIYDALESAED